MSERLTILALFVISTAFAQSQNICRLRLADQYDAFNNRGYLLYLEAIETDASQPCRLSSMKLVLAVGTGANTLYTFPNTPPWQQGVSYRVRVEIRPSLTSISLNGQTVYTGASVFVPANTMPFYMNRVVPSEAGRTELLWSNPTTQVSSGSSTLFKAMPQVQLLMFERLRETRDQFTVDAAQGVAVESTFQMDPVPALATFGAFVDGYGQSAHAVYNKIVTPSDFAARNMEETTRIAPWLQQANTDPYGAPVNAPWSDPASGYYRVRKINGYWWLLTPEGKPVFYVGLNNLPAIYDPLAVGTVVTGRTGLFSALTATPFRDPANSDRVYFFNQNLAQKYSNSWELSHWLRTLDRVKAWGFSGAGKWKSAAPPALAGALPRQGVTPELPVLPIWTFANVIGTAPGIDETPIGFPDIFDSAVRSQLEQFVRGLIGQRQTDPFVVGWSLGNQTHGVVTRANISAILSPAAQTAAKTALVDYAVDTLYDGDLAAVARFWQVPNVTARAQLYGARLTTLPPTDLSQLRAYFQRNLHRVYYETMKRVDPNHLYFGFWIAPNLVVTMDDWAALAEYVDVIGYNHYTGAHSRTFYRDLSQGIDKPIFNGEFSFPQTNGGQRGYGTAFPQVNGVASYDEAEAAARYTQFLENARQDPHVIGLAYHMYIDQPITGNNGPRQNPFGFSNAPLVQGEQYAFGLVDITDTPKWTLVEGVRNANRAATGARLQLTGTPTAQQQVTVRVTVSGNGSVTGSITCSSQCQQQFAQGTPISLFAAAGPGAVFSGWSGACIGAGHCGVTANSDLTVTAIFTGGTSGGGGGQVAQGALQYLPVQPCRLVDTRTPAGLLGGPAIDGGTSRSFPLLSGACGLPANAAAYSLNITVVPRGLLGYLTVWPTGQSQPLVSTLNSLDGRIKANAAIVPAGLNGAISIFATNTTDVIVDVNGVFVPPGGGTQSFYPVTPCRVADTRNAPGVYGSPSLAGGSTRTFPIATSGCGIPSSATAFSLNITVIPRGLFGYLTVWPLGQTQPVVSTLNAVTGAITANAAIVPSGINNSINVFATDAADLVIDINGYFAPPGGLNGLNFFAVTPCRISDSRNPNGPLGGPILAASASREYPVQTSSCSIPSTARGYSLNATVVPQGLLGYLTLWPSGIAQPFVSTLNAVDGAITSNAALVPAGGNGGIHAFVTNEAHLILDVNGYFAPQQ